MTDHEPDERFPEPDESAKRPGETHADWTARNQATAARPAEPATEEAQELAE